MLDYNLCLTLTSLVLCLLIFTRSILLRRQATTHSQLLAEQNISLKKYKEELSNRELTAVREQEFKISLQQAEITTELQQSRISFHQNKTKLRAPERYAYVRSMFNSGMQIEEISIALGMSSHEISQLLKLSSIAPQTAPFTRQRSNATQ